ncbi:MAG: hypothetical protein H7Y33_09945 [Cytophagales bacterium]|nr:hypothetical protein [Rhizobacter sp.]
MTQSPARTEADEQQKKQPAREGGGQKTSQERGAHTHNKKNPGKRPHQGGN